MADTDKLNIDSIIARLLEGKYKTKISCFLTTVYFYGIKTEIIRIN